MRRRRKPRPRVVDVLVGPDGLPRVAAVSSIRDAPAGFLTQKVRLVERWPERRRAKT
jgi:hypothetical protein